jgi:hypothetical protein
MKGPGRKEYKMAKHNQHVVPAGEEGWGIQGEGNSRKTSYHETQSEAIKEAKEIAKNQGSELFIHNRKGQIRERNTYGRDPYPPKG